MIPSPGTILPYTTWNPKRIQVVPRHEMLRKGHAMNERQSRKRPPAVSRSEIDCDTQLPGL